MTDIPKDATISQCKTVFANDLSESETVMLDIDRGLYFGVKDVGKVIWNQLEQPTTVEQICHALMQEYDVDDETCRRQVTQFISYLLDRELIDVHPNKALS